MAQIKISALTTGTPKGTDLTPATDTTDTTQAASGTTKKYIRSSEFNFYLNAQGYATVTACLVATTTAFTATYANGAAGVGATLTNAGAQVALTIDGVAMALSNRVLVKNQASTFQNGIYTVTAIGSGASNWVLTRATDYDQAAEIAEDQVVLINQGTISAGLAYQETAPGPFTIGTSPITFALMNSGSSTNFTWITVTGSSQQMASNNGYAANNAGVVTLTLPTTSVPGDLLEIAGLGAGGWSIAQTAGQQVHVGSVASTLGVGGSVASTNQFDSIRLRCVVASTIWTVVGAPQSAGLTIV